jgi:hypothetical protein
VARESAVGEQEGVLPERGERTRRQSAFAAAQRAESGADSGVGAALGGRHDADLRVGALAVAAAGAGPAELLVVLDGRRRVEDGAVHGQKQPPAVIGARRRRSGHDPGGGGEQGFHRLLADPGAGVGDRLVLQSRFPVT